MLKNILDKFILCWGCRKKLTINFKKGDTQIEIICTYCDKINKVKL
jgi:hypothetical protein